MATQIEQNTTVLQSILDTINALPDAGYDKDEVDAAVEDIATAIEGKGVTVPDGTTLDGMAALIDSVMADDGSFKAVIERTATNPSLPNDLTSIGSYAFYGCTNLALTELPSGVTSIGSYAFSRCASLALTSLPSGVTSIDGYAFVGCKGLTSLTFEGTPTYINSTAFDGCTDLTTINVPWAEGAVSGAPWGATNATINYNYTG